MFLYHALYYGLHQDLNMFCEDGKVDACRVDSVRQGAGSELLIAFRLSSQL